MIRRTASRFACVAVTLLGSSIVHAQFPTPPTIEVQSSNRSIDVSLSAEGFGTSQGNASMVSGTFSDRVFGSGFGTEGTSVEGVAAQSTAISSFSIRGTGAGSVEANVSPLGFAITDGLSELSVLFTIPTDGPFSLTGKLDSSSASDAIAFATMTLIGTRTDGSPFFYSETSQSALGNSDGEVPFSFNDAMKADTPATLTVTAGSSIGITATGPLSAQASFDFVFDFGDRDGDGLLNVWEKNGIDVDGDGSPEIDLPFLGADPDQKNLFVEIDVMAGQSIDLTAIEMVKRAFADAPVDGGKGIRLEVIWDDGDTPASIPLAANPWPVEFQGIKNGNFGSPADRARSDWETELKKARLFVFRYCLWADTVSVFGNDVFGKAEGTPSNDFILAAGRITSVATQKIKARAGLFMHELGHTLGLSHGGQDDEKYKPNYLSIMNDAYALPYFATTPQGTQAAEFWRLDFSRSTMITLDETGLIESDGVAGPAGRVIIFNSAADSDTPVKTVAWANASHIDWNNSGPKAPPDSDPVRRDVSRWTPSRPVEYSNELTPYTDWNRLWYHLTGNDHFSNAAPPEAGSIHSAVSVAEYEEALAGEWFDQTALGDEVFSNGFELGSTTAWSEAVP